MKATNRELFGVNKAPNHKVIRQSGVTCML